MSLNQFDTISALYDPLVKLVFGKAHLKSQKVFLNEIPNRATVMMLGGGAGEILRELIQLKPLCKITYIDASEKMISKAKKKIIDSTNINFIHGTQANIPDAIFDVVITNFYLDLFAADTLQAVIEKINNSLRQNSQWLITDFADNGKWWQRIMLKVMYLFFKITCKIEADRLTPWKEMIHEAGFIRAKFAFFYSGFITSELYRRAPNNQSNLQ